MKPTILLLLPLVLVGCSAARSAKGEGAGENMSAPLSPAALAYAKQTQADVDAAQAAVLQLEALQGPKTVSTVLEPLNALWIILDRALNTAGLYRNVHPDAGLRGQADAFEQALSKIVTNIGLSRPLYEAVTAVDIRHEDAVTQRYVGHILRDFRRAGVDKDETTRNRIRQLKDELVQVGQVFDKNIREDVRQIKLPDASALTGLPDDYIQAHKPDAHGNITISTDYPDYLPFMSYARNDAARLELYRVFRQRGFPNNEPVLKQLLAKRYELAQLLGYKTWADYITEDKMIKTAPAAQAFIDKINGVAKSRAERDYNELLTRLRREIPGTTQVGDWQKTYIEEIVKREDYQFDSQAARQFFQFGRVRQGLFDITSKIFGVTYHKVETEVWDDSVETYELRDHDKVIGRFYLDLHPRTDKYKHAAMFPVRSGVLNTQIPEAALVCNFPAGENALMEHDEVETFFHEFGHLLHHLFAGKQRWVGVSGISTEWDFVEAPSQMLEEWTFDATTLKTFAQNTDGKTIDDSLISAMRRARDFGKGLWVKHQLFYAAVSLAFHDRNPATLDTRALMQTLQAKYSPFPYVPDTYFQLSFGHLEGYSAIYYTYMWSLVIAKDLFSVFEHDGLLNPSVASRYRHAVLEPGGSKDAADLCHDFIGRDFSFDAFGRWINAD